jgi:hypothetical protein
LPDVHCGAAKADRPDGSGPRAKLQYVRNNSPRHADELLEPDYDITVGLIGGS